jgi:hypothetical protein
MKTDDLINALAADRQVVPGARATLLRVVPAATVVLLATVLLTLGIRADAATAVPAMAMKIAVSFSLAAIACALLPIVATPGRKGGAWHLLWLPPLILAGFVILDLAGNGMAGAMGRLMGQTAFSCFVLIPLLSILPLGGLLFAMRRGMPADASRAGALAGLAAGAIAATVYALHCTEDSPLFVACWYTLAVLAVTGAGAAIGSRILRW